MAIAAAFDRVAFGLTLPLMGGLQRGDVTIRRLPSVLLLWVVWRGFVHTWGLHNGGAAVALPCTWSCSCSSPRALPACALGLPLKDAGLNKQAGSDRMPASAASSVCR
jgi:hypothetical protein